MCNMIENHCISHVQQQELLIKFFFVFLQPGKNKCKKKNIYYYTILYNKYILFQTKPCIGHCMKKNP